MDDTFKLWYSLNKDCSEPPKVPVVLETKESDTKEPIPAFIKDIEALSRRFPSLESTLNGENKPLTLEISLKEIFILCPRNRQRIDRYSKLQEYLKETFGVKLIIKSQKMNEL